jgi:tetratricopeptide (TPR) repeat protein
MRAVLRNCLSRISAVGAVVVTAVVWLPPAHAQHKCTPAVARLVSIEGNVKVFNAEGKAVEDVAPNAELCARYVVEVGEHSRAALLLLSNETTLRLDQKSSLTLRGVDAADKDATWAMRLNRGAVHVITRTRPRSFNVETPFINASVDGTEFTVTVSESEATVALQEGRVCVSNAAGSARIDGATRTVASYDDAACSAGEKSKVAAMAVSGRAGQAPVARGDITVEPKDHVKWALYYPAVFDYASVQEDLASLARPEATPERVSDPRLSTRYAGALLSVGRLDDAERFIARSLAIDADDSSAHALLAVIAVVRNDKQRALDEATKATQTDPASPAAWVALSYAQQASFQIEQAVRTMEEARSKVAPSALFLARLAELYMSLGELDKARAAAEEASARNPNLAKVQTVSGFAHLISIDIAKAKQAFTEAIRFDQGDPLPRLGLGLAKIREGDLSGGREELEIAAVLDPANSLIRSYLGKAYYEEKRDQLASRQFDLAKQLDANDPTPWFYQAILQQSLNRPVEAMRDFEKSIELNENRAVYRSRLLLDEDAAVRGTSLARTFIELDLPEAATTLAAKSLALDPSNAAAHRFLSDVYATSQRGEIGRASELLQAQLRQPLSVIPLQAQLSNDKFLLSKTIGPSTLGLNEFSSLYAANGVGVEAYGVAGSNHTVGQQLLAYGVWDRFGIGVSELRFRTDGIRENDDQDNKQQTVLAQAALTPKTGVQFEYSFVKSASGDLTSYFDPGNVLTSLRNSLRDETFRLGFRQLVGPGSDILLVATRRDRKDTADIIEGFTIAVRNVSTKVELQHQLRAQHFSLTSGITFLEADTTEDVVGFVSESNPRHFNVYSYATFGGTRSDTPYVQAGLSYDRLHSRDAGDQEQLNPKLGVIWNPVPTTTVRAAIFRALKRRINEDAGLEPSNVVGFTQYFDDANGTRYWGAGASVDTKLSESTRAGLEFGGRNLDVPLTNVDQTIQFDGWRERQATLYAHQLLGDSAVISGRLRYSRFDRLEISRGLELFTYVDTMELPVSARIFAANGLWLQLAATHVRQRGQFTNPAQELFNATEHFGVVDAAVGYRLPRRTGDAWLECTNIGNTGFRFQDVGVERPRYVPERRCLFHLALTF